MLCTPKRFGRGNVLTQRGMEGCGIGGVVNGVDSHHDAGIGVAFIARVLAHAVGDHAAWLRCGRHHRATGAHAKAVDGAAVIGVVHQFVVGGAQARVAGMTAPAGAVNHALRVLNAKPDGKGFGVHRHTALEQHGDCVTRAVA